MRLGDYHNFGRCVQILNKEWITKPRDCHFEFTIFSKRSPLRKFLDEIFTKDGYPLTNLPYLKFKNVIKKSLISNTHVEMLRIEEVKTSLNEEQLKYIGSLMAICLFFGIGDLHEENIIIGRDLSTKNLYIAPIDLEVNLTSTPTLKHTLLLNTNSKHVNPGLIRIKNLIGNPEKVLNILEGFVNGIILLNENITKIRSILSKINSNQKISTRVLVRDTNEYKKKIKSKLYEEESTQLTRGDIPYFFRYYKEKNIYFWKTPNKKQSVSDELNKNTPKKFAIDVINHQRQSICVSQIISFFIQKKVFINSSRSSLFVNNKIIVFKSRGQVFICQK